MPAIVETRDLTRRYGSMVALDQLNLEIPQGAIFGFIGPNGAGKTTTMRILTTLLPASDGEAWVAGHSVLKDPLGVRKVVGFLPDFFGVYDNMKVWEYLDFFGRSYSVTAARRATMIGELLNLVDLGHKRDEFVMTLSRGMKQRLSLARTMIHDPALLILDEPASGLDPRARIELRVLDGANRAEALLRDHAGILGVRRDAAADLSEEVAQAAAEAVASPQHSLT